MLIHLKGYDKPIGTIHIFNSMGQLMEVIISDTFQEEINLSHFPKGIYFIKVIDNQQVEKVILQ
jgi:Secretion system C-terminal sorting domain